MNNSFVSSAPLHPPLCLPLPFSTCRVRIDLQNAHNRHNMESLPLLPLHSKQPKLFCFSELKDYRPSHCTLRFSRKSSTASHRKYRRRNRSLVSFQDVNFKLSNVAEALHDIQMRLTNAEHVVRLRGYLRKRDEGANDSTAHKEVEAAVILELPFVSDCTFDVGTPKGNLSPAAISCIEQFSRLSGLTGKQIRRMFYAQSSVPIQSDGRNFVEYCCFRYLSRFSGDFHPGIKEAAFRRLIFITMLAWQQPYANAESHHRIIYENEKIISENAFIRIAPAVAGVADRPTACHLFRTIANGKEGISFSLWDTYLLELLRVHEERSDHRKREGSSLSLDGEESIVCVGANSRQPIQMWNEKNIAWPGRLTLTNQALYFEPNGIMQHQKPMKLDLQGGRGGIQKKMVGPFGVPVLDTSIVVTSDGKSQPWTLDFFDLSGGGRREVWFSFINEILSVYAFIAEYAPAENDPFLHHVFGSVHGRKKAVTSAVNAIARVQAVQSMLGKLLEHPRMLLQFSYIREVPCGELIAQSLAVRFWGGHIQTTRRRLLEDRSSTNTTGTGFHVIDVDGSIYLQRWMRSETWNSTMSSHFWKHKAGGKGLIMGKDFVVGDTTYLDRAVKISLEQRELLEKTKATLNGALVKGIPSNIDLFKELMLPFTLLSINIRKLQKWENPKMTILFLASCFIVLCKNWLRYCAPSLLMISSATMFIYHNVKSEGNLLKVTIKEQPPSNTLQKIIALKEALAEVEVQIQKVNIALLKLRSLIMAGHPQGKSAVAVIFFGVASILLFVPFRYVLGFILIDQFTSELRFRRGMVLKWRKQLSEWWDAIPVSPVEILPHENQQTVVSEIDDAAAPTMRGEVIAEAVKEWFAESF